MRTDVKLGVLFSMAIVLALGGYFMYPRGENESIPLANAGKSSGESPKNDRPKSTKQIAPNLATKVASRKVSSSPKRSSNFKPAPGRQVNPQKRKPRLANRDNPNRPIPKSNVFQGKGQIAPGRKPRPGHNPEKLANRLNTNRPSKGRRNATDGGPKAINKQPQVARNSGFRPDAPTPPGLLAATRKKEAVKPQAAVDLHRVQPGDSFASLSKTYYGTSKYVTFLMKANPTVDPARMRVGTTIRIPALPAAKDAASVASRSRTNSKAGSSARRQYTVKPGDSFYRIAEQQLGDASRWKELFELNKKTVGQDPSRLKVGQVLTLPNK